MAALHSALRLKGACYMRGRNNTDDSRYYFDWLEFAAADLLAAKVLCTNGSCNSLSAFHCQQAIEKALKGYALYKTGHLVDGHNLPWLCRNASRYDPAFKEWLDESAAKARLYIETRYPSDKQLKKSDEGLQVILDMAEDMNNFICENVMGKEKKAQS